MFTLFTNRFSTPSTIEIQIEPETMLRLMRDNQLSVDELRVLNRKSKNNIRRLALEASKYA